MFTGIVEGTGRIASIRRSGRVWRLEIRAGRIGRGVRRGGSVAVNGCCLTALGAARSGVLRFDLVQETWRRTAFRRLRQGDRVNLERPLRWGQPLGGHLVLGHVDGTGRVVSRTPDGRLKVALPAALRRWVVPKGSIALDGVSLTVARVLPAGLEAALIPETLRRTTLGAVRPGDPVNVEADLLLRKAWRLRRVRKAPPRPSRRPAGTGRALRS